MRVLITYKDGTQDRRNFPDDCDVVESITFVKPDGSGSFTIKNVKSWRRMSTEEIQNEQDGILPKTNHSLRLPWSN